MASNSLEVQKIRVFYVNYTKGLTCSDANLLFLVAVSDEGDLRVKWSNLVSCGIERSLQQKLRIHVEEIVAGHLGENEDKTRENYLERDFLFGFHIILKLE